jgi:hypothetical protein
VDTEEGVKQMQKEVIDALPDLASISSYWDFVPIGIDTEWEPYARSQAATPVAVLQISTRDKVFLLDMQALVRSVRRNRCDRSGEQTACRFVLHRILKVGLMILNK